MATPKKLPSGNWRIQVYSHSIDGKKKKVSFTAPTKAEANRLAAEFMANKANEKTPQNITVEYALEKYIKDKSNVLSPTTYREYKRALKVFEPIAKVRIGSLSSSTIQSFVNELSKDKSPKTVRNYYSQLLSSIQMFSDRKFHVTLPQKKNIERHIPTDADVNTMLEMANTSLKLAILLSSIGTLRRGEICALKYGDIMQDFNAIYVHSDMVLGENGWEYKEIPKTSSSTRRVVLPKYIIELLGEGENDEFIIKVKPSTITSDFINLRNRLGLECRFHDLRHYAASIMHALNIPDVYIMEKGGWSSDSVLKSVYRNSLSDKASHFTSIANEYFEKNIKVHTKVPTENCKPSKQA